MSAQLALSLETDGVSGLARVVNALALYDVDIVSLSARRDPSGHLRLDVSAVCPEEHSAALCAARVRAIGAVREVNMADQAE